MRQANREEELERGREMKRDEERRIEGRDRKREEEIGKR